VNRAPLAAEVTSETMARLTLGSDAVDDVDEFIFTFVKWGEHHHDEVRTKGLLPLSPVWSHHQVVPQF
jgi:hypothetical protein